MATGSDACFDDRDIMSREPVPADYLEFFAVDDDLIEPVTKFGGQPVWVDEPRWPMSRLYGTKMTFVGQIALDEALFPGSAGSMAYIFMSGETGFVETSPGSFTWDGLDFEPWNPHSGESAVVIQPGGAPLDVDTVADADGPAVDTLVAGEKRALVYDVERDRRIDPGYLTVAEWADWRQRDPEGFDSFYANLVGDKIGGTPAWIQDSEFPDCDTRWRLLAQLGTPPFELALGDGGVAYVLIDQEGTRGGIVVQSY
jgi:hypothetical protein